MTDDRQWYHCILTVYGAWLNGDPRGFRTRHHREHIEGDYKNPPPEGAYAHYERHSLESLKPPPVVLARDLRPTLGNAPREKLEGLGGLVVCVAVGGQHVHILAKIAAGQPRMHLGHAKRHAWFVLREHGWTHKLWAKRSQEIAVRDREHQLNVYHYILDHAQEGAWVWSMTQTK